MLDTFRGMPVHALVLHATVVLVPLMALVTVLVAVVPRWRSPGAWPAVAANVLTTALVWVTQQSGEALQRRLPASAQIDRHAQLAGTMIWFMLGLLAASVLVALVRRRRGGLVTAVGVVSVLAALATTVWVARVGDSGASAVWKDVVTSTNGPTG